MALVRKIRKLGARGGFAAAQRDASTLRPRQVPKAAPCVAACPNDTDIRGALTSIARSTKNGRSLDEALDEAFYLIVERNPLPAVSARVCPHHCEDHCHRAGYDEPLSINQVESYLAERALERALPLRRLEESARAERIAVAGAGAAGLSLAYQLGRRGYHVILFDPAEAAGGELRDGLPKGLVPRDLVDREIARVTDLGIEVRFDPRVTDALWAPPAAEQFARTVRTRVRTPGHPVDPGSIVPAICFGRRQAEMIDAELNGRAVERPTSEATIARDRIKFDYYAHKPRLRATAAPGNAAAGSTPEEILAEAERCLSCGACWECDNCYKYCPEQAVVKPLAAGQPYRFKLEFCNGCSKCADECACGYVEMR
jgi:ferredoxin